VQSRLSSGACPPHPARTSPQLASRRRPRSPVADSPTCPRRHAGARLQPRATACRGARSGVAVDTSISCAARWAI
jgi:hypothetical protein